MAFPLAIWERARLLLLADYREDEVASNLSLEFADYLDEFQLEDLPLMVRSANKQLQMIKRKNHTPVKERGVYGEPRASVKEQGSIATITQPKQSNDDTAEKSGTFG